jgi:hypothetical protein
LWARRLVVDDALIVGADIRCNWGREVLKPVRLRSGLVKFRMTVVGLH